MDRSKNFSKFPFFAVGRLHIRSIFGSPAAVRLVGEQGAGFSGAVKMAGEGQNLLTVLGKSDTITACGNSHLVFPVHSRRDSGFREFVGSSDSLPFSIRYGLRVF